MAASSGNAGSLDFGFHTPARVLCASCGRHFDMPRLEPGDRVRCATCGEVVTVGARVGVQRRAIWSRAFVEPGVDEGRGKVSDAVLLAALCSVLVAGTFLLLAAFCLGDGPPEGRGPGDSSDAEPVVTTDSGEW